jgi:hypothetical protein
MSPRVARVVSLLRKLELDDQEVQELRAELDNLPLVDMEGCSEEDRPYLELCAERLARPSEHIPMREITRRVNERLREIRRERRRGAHRP